MRRKGLALLVFLITASCRGPAGDVPMYHETQYEADLIRQDLQDYTRLIERNPDHADAYVHRAMVYVQLGYYDKAIEDFTKAIEIDPTAGSTYGKRGATHLEKKEYEELISFLKNFDHSSIKPIQPHDFEKDDDTNFHIDFTTACSNMRAWNYQIKVG